MKNDLNEICNAQKSYKKILKNKIKIDTLDKWFDGKLCDNLPTTSPSDDKSELFLKNSFIMTNAINFDFSGTTTKSSGYFGHLNYFFNTYRKDGSFTKNFINTGLMKVNYFSSELNTGSLNQIDNVKILL